jgi:hypothetical protein
LQDAEILQTIAEISIALAGFTGVVAFFGDRGRGTWSSADLWRFGNLLHISISTLLFSFTPILLVKLGVDVAGAWKLSSALMAAHFAVSTVQVRRSFRALPENDRPEIVPLIAGLLFALEAIVFLLLVASAAGVAYSGESAPVLVALVWRIGMAAYQFVMLLGVLRPRGGAAQQGVEPDVE